MVTEKILRMEYILNMMYLAMILLIGIGTIINILVMTRGQKKDVFINQGIITAFFLSFFIEMWGIIVSVYSVETLIIFDVIQELYPDFYWAVLSLFQQLNEKIGLLYTSEFNNLRILYVEQIGYYMPYILCPIGISIIFFGFIQIHKAKNKNEICTSYFYKHIRNPQYWGFILFLLGWNLQYPLLISWLIFPYFIILYIWLAISEEKYLEKKFGEKYIEYKKKTKRFIPKVF